MSHFRNVPDKAGEVWQGTGRSGWNSLWGASLFPYRILCSFPAPQLSFHWHTLTRRWTWNTEVLQFALLFPDWKKTNQNPKPKRVERLWDDKHSVCFLRAKYENKMAEQKAVLLLLLRPQGWVISKTETIKHGNSLNLKCLHCNFDFFLVCL